jgi:hypothetical protein
MVTIQIDDHTAQALERQARSAGLSIADFLRSLVPESAPRPRLNWDQIEREINDLSTSGPSLPDGFSRADIYHDHD